MTPERQQFLNAEQGKILTVEEAAYVLRTTRATVLRMCRMHTLPHWREGNVIRIHIESLTPPHKEGRHESPIYIAPAAPPAEAEYQARIRQFRAAAQGGPHA